MTANEKQRKNMREQKMKEIETIKEREITVRLSDADCDRLAKKCGEYGLTVGELMENFIGDLVDGTYSNGSDERDYAERWFERCSFGMSEPTLLNSLLFCGYDPVDYLNTLENIKNAREEKRRLRLEEHPEEADEEIRYIDDVIAEWEEDLKGMSEDWKPETEPNMDEEIEGIKRWAKERENLIAGGTKASGRIFGCGFAGIVRRNVQCVEWIDIQDIVRQGRAGMLLPPGTEIYFELKNGVRAQVVVIGLDHYKKGDAVFWFRQIVGRHCMKWNNNNEGGFPGAEDMREYLKKIYKLLPDELQNVIALHKTTQKIGGETMECEDCLFLPTEFEGCGKVFYSEYNGVGKQFPFFKERRNRIAYDADGDPVYYWTADPSAANTMGFCTFASYGGSDDGNASAAGGVAPLFVIE